MNGNNNGDIYLMQSTDYGPEPYVMNIYKAAQTNKTYRTVVWTGAHLQTAIMDIGVNDDIGLERHPDIDQYIYVVDGQGQVVIGNDPNKLYYQQKVYPGYAVFVPAGAWHDIMNTGTKPMKLISIYAPPEHPQGTIHRTKDEAMEAEGDI